jgi:hypothetical protein
MIEGCNFIPYQFVPRFAINHTNHYGTNAKRLSSCHSNYQDTNLKMHVHFRLKPKGTQQVAIPIPIENM